MAKKKADRAQDTVTELAAQIDDSLMDLSTLSGEQPALTT